MYANPEKIINNYNKLALDQAKLKQFDNAMSYWRQALLILKGMEQDGTTLKLLTITFTNIGCFYNKIHKQTQALDYLYKAVELGKKIPVEVNSMAAAYLNICAILSSRGKHHEALKHVVSAVKLLKRHC